MGLGGVHGDGVYVGDPFDSKLLSGPFWFSQCGSRLLIRKKGRTLSPWAPIVGWEQGSRTKRAMKKKDVDHGRKIIKASNYRQTTASSSQNKRETPLRHTAA